MKEKSYKEKSYVDSFAKGIRTELKLVLIVFSISNQSFAQYAIKKHYKQWRSKHDWWKLPAVLVRWMQVTLIECLTKDSK